MRDYRYFYQGGLLLLAFLFFSQPSFSHESRPALLSLTETESGIYSGVWKVPAKGQMKLKLGVEFSEGCTVSRWVDPFYTIDAWVERLSLDCLPDGLAGAEIYVPGLDRTITDVFLRVTSASGKTMSAIIRPQQPSYTVPVEPDKFDVMASYSRLGIAHIAGGLDHLLFIVGLMLLISNFRSLLITISSFTLAHSITLASVALGVVPQPGSAIEVIIALSILFLIYEGLRRERGLSSMTIRNPWAAAFIFGLLHGFGFADALAQIGFPIEELPLALLSFNVGIEAGQIIFVVALTLLALSIRSLGSNIYRVGTTAISGCVGITASYWFFERLANMITIS